MRKVSSAGRRESCVNCGPRIRAISWIEYDKVRRTFHYSKGAREGERGLRDRRGRKRGSERERVDERNNERESARETERAWERSDVMDGTHLPSIT